MINRALRREKLRGLKFWGTGDFFDISKMMTVQIELVSIKPEMAARILGLVYRYLYKIIREGYDIEQDIQKENRYAFFYGFSNYRQDHKNIINKFVGYYKDADSYLALKNYKYNNIFSIIKSIFWGWIWFFQGLSQKCTIYESLYMLPYIYEAHFWDCYLKKIDSKKYKFIVVYYDVSPDENYIVQYFKDKNIITMTLQHGIFASKENVIEISDTAIELRDSISDYYLAWNNYTKEEALKVGVDGKKIRVLGIPKFIGDKVPSIQTSKRNNRFGVILNNSSFDYHNRCLIDAANAIYTIFGIGFIVRYHPQLRGDEYDSLLGDGFIGKDNLNTTIREYADKVDFTIISSSSVFIDLLFLRKNVYRLRVSENDTYSSVYANSFGNIEELEGLLKNNNEMQEEIFAYLCNNDNVYQNYKSFFDEVLISNNLYE